MPQYWMITNRNQQKDGFGRDRAALTFWVADAAPLDRFASWKEVSEANFRRLLLGAAGQFPLIEDPEKHEEQKHVTLFVHGYDNSWKEAAGRYETLARKLFGGAKGLGLCVLFTWPSDAMKLAYLPDRKDAAESAGDFAEVLNALYDLLAERQVAGMDDSSKACRAKTSVIAHSMGNYLLQKAMQLCWTRKNQPLLVSLIHQLLMVAADVDNDLFKSGEAVDKSDGDAIANLTYRVTALYTGRDPVLGLSAGLKHFGKRRLGRSGLDTAFQIPDNVWDVDCTSLIPSGAENIHSIYFKEPKILELMRGVLRGMDRKFLVARGVAPGKPE